MRRQRRQVAELVAAAALVASWIGPIPGSAAAKPIEPACTVVGTAGPDVLVGTPGDDVICGRGGADRIAGRGGNDVLRGGRGNDVLKGGRGDDTFFDGAGDDIARGGAGRDRVRGGKGDDSLGGGDGPDLVQARDGDRFHDRVSCGRGRDSAAADEVDRVREDCERVTQNDPPTDVTLDPATVAENAPAGTEVGELSAADPDPGDSHTFRLVSGPGADDNDSFTLSGRTLATAAVFDFEVDAELSVRVRASDRTGSTFEKSLTVSVEDVNETPVAVDDDHSTDEDAGPSAVPVLANDVDQDGDALEIGSVTQPDNGQVDITGGGTGLTYAPDPDYCNRPGGPSDTFTYTLASGGSTATVAVAVTCVDDPPTAANDNVTLTEDAGATTIDVLANDTDVDGGPLSVDSVTQPTNGTVVITNGGADLSYEPDANYCNDPGPQPVDAFDYTLNGGSTATVSVTVTCVGDAPVVTADSGSATFTEGDPPTVIASGLTVSDLDSASLTSARVRISANFAAGDDLVFVDQSGITGSFNTGTGVLTLTGTASVANYQAALRSVQYRNLSDDPSILPRTVEFTVTDGDGLSGSDSRGIQVVPVDDLPQAVDDSTAVTEDAPPVPIHVLSNDTDRDGGTKTVESVTNPAYGTVAITDGGSGVSYQPNTDFCGTDTFTYTLNGGSTATVVVSVTCFDDDPTAVDDAASVLLNASATTITVLANDANADGGPITVDSVNQPANGTVVITNGGADLTYQPDTDYCNDPPGTELDTFTYTLNGGSFATVSVTVTCDTPPAAVADSPTVAEDSGATTVDVLANDTDPDGGPMTVESVTDPANGTAAITNSGADLSYEPDPNYCDNPPGTTPDTFTYTLNGGSTATVSVTVTCVDDAPVAVADSATVAEDTPAPIAVLANDTDVDGGPITVDAVTQPDHGVVTGAGGNLTYTPSANYCNDPGAEAEDTFTYTLNGGSTATVSVTVTCVNDAPTPVADSFDAIGNTGLFVGTTRPAGEAGREITGSVLSNDTDPDTPHASLVAVAETKATTGGGTVTIETDGNFTFHPDDGDTTDSFTYTVSDGDGSADGTVSLVITGEVWYVDNSEAAGGDGTSDTPFDTLAEAEAASGAGDTTFVHDGDNTSVDLHTGYQMAPGERLIGEVSGLTLDPDGGGSLPLSVLHSGTSGAHPTLTASGEDVVALDDANVVRGLVIDPSGTGGGIAGAAGDTGGGTVDDVRILDTGTAGMQPGLELNGTTGTFDLSNLSIDNKATGVLLDNAGTVNFAASGAISITTTGARGLDATGTAMGAGSAFDDITVTASGSGGVSMVNTTGTTTFANLALTTTSGGSGAFVLSNAGAVTVPADGTANVSATGGPAVDVTGTSGATLSFDDVDSTDSAGDGINLAGLGSGTFTANPGSSISNAAGVAFDLDGGSGDVTYGGTITDDVGQLVRAQNTGGGTKLFSGAITDGDDGDGDGISLTNNGGATVRFTGGLTLSTGTNPAFAATGGGTLAVTGTNTIATTTGTALNVANTSIHGDGLILRSISANGAPNGVVLNNTGSGGGLTVTGNGGSCAATGDPCTGGAIRSTTGDALSLTTTQNVSLTRMKIVNNLGNGIRGSSVTGFQLADSVVDNNADNATTDEAGLHFTNLGGTASITRTAVSNHLEDNAKIINTSVTLTQLDVTDSVFRDTDADAPGNNGLLLQADGGSITADVLGTDFLRNRTNGLQVVSNGTGSINVEVDDSGGQQSDFDDNNIGVSIAHNSSGTFSYAVRDLTIDGHNVAPGTGGSASPINLNLAGSATSPMVGTVSGNTLTNSSSTSGPGIRAVSNGAATMTVAITSNTISQVMHKGIDVLARDGSSRINATVTNNTVTIPNDPLAGDGIRIDSAALSTDTTTVCADLTGNTVSSPAYNGIRVRQRFTGSRFILEDYAGSPTDDPGVIAFVSGANNGAVTAADHGSAAGFETTSECPTP